MTPNASPETLGVGLTRQAIIDAININVSVSMGDYYLEHVEDAADAILAMLPADKSQTDMGERVAELEAGLRSALELARRGADKAGCDGWRAQEMCRQIASILDRALLNPKLEG